MVVARVVVVLVAVLLQMATSCWSWMTKMTTRKKVIGDWQLLLECSQPLVQHGRSSSLVIEVDIAAVVAMMMMMVTTYSVAVCHMVVVHQFACVEHFYPQQQSVLHPNRCIEILPSSCGCFPCPPRCRRIWFQGKLPSSDVLVQL